MVYVLDDQGIRLQENEIKKVGLEDIRKLKRSRSLELSSRRAASMMTARRMSVTGRGSISTDEIGKAGWCEGSEDGGGGARDPGSDVGSVDGGDRDGDSVG